MTRFFPDTPGLEEHRRRVTFLVSWYNEIFCRIVEDSAGLFSSADSHDPRALNSIRSEAGVQRRWLEDELALQRQEFFTRSDFPLEIVVGEVAHASV